MDLPEYAKRQKFRIVAIIIVSGLALTAITWFSISGSSSNGPAKEPETSSADSKASREIPKPIVDPSTTTSLGFNNERPRVEPISFVAPPYPIEPNMTYQEAPTVINGPLISPGSSQNDTRLSPVPNETSQGIPDSILPPIITTRAAQVDPSSVPVPLNTAASDDSNSSSNPIIITEPTQVNPRLAQIPFNTVEPDEASHEAPTVILNPIMTTEAQEEVIPLSAEDLENAVSNIVRTENINESEDEPENIEDPEELGEILSIHGPIPELDKIFANENDKAVVDVEEQLEEIKQFGRTNFLKKLPDPFKPDGRTLGITNPGNKCYASSVLQILYRIPIIRKIVTNIRLYHKIAPLYESDLDKLNENFKVIEGIYHMFYQLYHFKDFAKDKCEYQFAPVQDLPEDQIELARNIHKYFRGYQCFRGDEGNNNNPEFVGKYLDDALNSIKTIIPQFQKDKIGFNYNEYYAEDVFAENPNLTDNQLSFMYTDDNRIVDENGNKKGASFMHLIKTFFDNTNPPLKWRTIPEFITISINRPGHGLRYGIDFTGEDLDLTEFFASDLLTKHNSIKYKFMNAFIVHENGNGIASGPLNHYVAYIRESDGIWYKYDDAKVTKISDKYARQKMKMADIYVFLKK